MDDFHCDMLVLMNVCMWMDWRDDDDDNVLDDLDDGSDSGGERGEENKGGNIFILPW